ncbi:hypothetical protein H5410_036084 [Solanum commersonii]|uniref:Uncharacterized protein n=1 Tax=Solanum commersonii TaxID=4109 RepID=A0A9J5Y6I5_SOLCO|nr:hypothetical protein H5410_036084 [Solanum commersonii]
MLQNLRCKILTVRKALRGDAVSINYDAYTYEKLISVCNQEGISLCNEIKLNQQIKIYHLNEKQQLGKFCEQFAIDMPESSKKSNRHRGKRDYKKKPHIIDHYARNCKVKDKIKRLDLEDNIKDSLYKILLNSSSKNSSPNNSDGEESSTSEDLKVLHEEDCMSSSKEECTACHIGQSCDNKDKDEFYQLYSRFKDLNINVISNDNWVEMLRMIDDLTLRSQIIDKIGNTTTSINDTRIPKESPAHNNAYTMAEVKRQLKLRSQRNHKSYYNSRFG